MAKINNTTAYEQTTPLPSDLLIGSRMSMVGKTINIAVADIANVVAALFNLTVSFHVSQGTYEGDSNIFQLPDDAGNIVSVVQNQTPIFNWIYDAETKQVTVNDEMWEGDQLFFTYAKTVQNNNENTEDNESD